MTRINAYKMDGLGNDFVIIDRRKNSINLTKEKIIELGSRSNIGFDQVIFIEKQKEKSFPNNKFLTLMEVK
jgi:Diaminopimelate epimerase